MARPTARLNQRWLVAFTSVAVLLLTLFQVGNPIWLAKRRRNPQPVPRSDLPGVGNGTWFALVTLITGGDGDHSPVTMAGRTIAGVWMVTTVPGVSSITAGLASAFMVALAQVPAGGGGLRNHQ